MFKTFALALALLTLTACKVAVVAIEGGEIQSIGSGTCAEGTNCVHDIVDTNFDEEFSAVSNAGWYFERWVTGEEFFCKPETNPVCTVSTLGTEAIPGINEILASDDTFYVMPVFKEFKNTVTVFGKEWYQTNLFAGLTYDDIHTACPTNVCGTGVTLNGLDVEGWTWATVADVADLANSYDLAAGGLAQVDPEPGWYIIELNAILNFFADGWRPTWTFLPFPRMANDALASDFPDAQVGDPPIPGRIPYSPLFEIQPGFWGEVRTDWTPGFADQYAPGAWFYRDVPGPSPP